MIVRGLSCTLIIIVAIKAGQKLYILWKDKSGKEEEFQAINEVLFFPDSEYPCSTISKGLLSKERPKSTPVQKLCRNPSCMRLHGRTGESPSSMLKFVTYLSMAEKSVDLCIYMFTQSNFSDIIRQLHQSGVSIRIITDGGEDEANGTQVSKLQLMGIEVRSNKRGTGALMHHKFVIIDDKILLSGSFNWTNRAVVSNYEAVLVTSSKSLVNPFVDKFNEMWQMFDAHKVKGFRL